MARKVVLKNLSIRKRCFIDRGYIKWFNIKVLDQLINVININSSMISDERLARINDLNNDVVKQGVLIVQTVNELTKRFTEQN